ncbi:hypothetical protein DFH07DRAFT_97507 [Mycena maculata]|uniref:Uncharacterized protein n=1 Tax=Mycena maculata TaxID=230809 RepID=A0AAD7I7Y0_9AGAR|nr:hypothetical protein DFH07DRAFT_97507 [Mycena maculata]
MGLATPPDDTHDAPAGGVVWPTLNSKKSVGSIGRNAASLAGRMFHRTRSKSSTSTLSSVEASSPPPPMPVPAMPSPPALKLDSTPFVIPPIQTSLHGEDPGDSPTSSTPIGDPFVSQSITPSTAKPKSSLPHTRPPNLVLTTSTSPPAALLPLPKTAPETRPASWMSVSSDVSSGGSSSVAQSPLFDKAIFDAFPSVPQMPPPHTHTQSYAHAGASALSAGPVRPLPVSPAGAMTSPPPAYSEYALGGGAGLPLLGRLAETQRRVNPLP